MSAERHDTATSDQLHLEIALEIGRRGAPIWTFPPSRGFAQGGDEFRFSKNRRTHSQSVDEVASRYRPGWALAAGTGVQFDVVDVDPRNGGRNTFDVLRDLMPPTSGLAATPGGGEHWYLPPADAGTRRFGGIDYLGRQQLVFLPGTHRPKYGNAGYTWVSPLNWDLLAGNGSVAVVECLEALRRSSHGRGSKPVLHSATRPTGFLSNRAIEHLSRKVAEAMPGHRNQALNDAGYEAGQRLGTCDGPHATRTLNALLHASGVNGLWQEDPSGVRSTVESAMRRGAASASGRAF